MSTKCAAGISDKEMISLRFGTNPSDLSIICNVQTCTYLWWVRQCFSSFERKQLIESNVLSEFIYLYFDASIIRYLVHLGYLETSLLTNDRIKGSPSNETLGGNFRTIFSEKKIWVPASFFESF